MEKIRISRKRIKIIYFSFISYTLYCFFFVEEYTLYCCCKYFSAKRYNIKGKCFPKTYTISFFNIFTNIK